MLGCGFPTTFLNRNANLQHGRWYVDHQIKIVPLLELELPVDPCAVEVYTRQGYLPVGFVEPLTVLLAKPGILTNPPDFAGLSRVLATFGWQSRAPDK